jgi:hypothetical protein
MIQSAIRTLSAVLSLAGLTGTVAAQVETLSPEQLAQYQQRLPAAVQVAANTAFKAYLQGLQRREAGAGTPEQKAALAREVANAVRVAEDARTGQSPAGAYFAYYSVPPMSSLMRLPNAYPVDGAYAGELAIVAAQDEYEPASFVVHPYQDVSQVSLTTSDLKSADGTVFSKENLDLKVVKVWYQNGNGWFSYFSDIGLALVPELLVNDENLIRVDTQQQANYARVNTPAGPKQVWISAPRKIDVPFDPYTDGFADAKVLQPVTFNAGQFKQFFLTAHVPSGTKPGLYRGSIQVTAAGHPATQIPVAVRVLPFALPAPKANYDVNKDFIVTLMGAWPRVDANNKAFMPTLLDLRRHNVLHLGPNAGPNTPPAVAEANVKAMKTAGFDTKFIINGNLPWVGQHDGTPLTFDELMTIKRSAQAWREFYLKYFGHTNAAVGLGDEQGAAWVVKTRPAWRIANEAGLKTALAGHTHIFDKGGYMLDVHPAAGSPSEKDKAETWRAVGHGHVGFYASQHNGSEDPDFVRRQHGLLGYLSDFDMVDNYEFAYGPWNDRAYDLYKPMVLAYPTSEGLVDTLAWEGFREGIDDIRYATKLRQLAEEAIASGNLDRVYAGRQVRQWFALMDGNMVDLSTIRLEMIDRIERLTKLAQTSK